jgi:large exoprotein involved in heme utilization and adhesion
VSSGGQIKSEIDGGGAEPVADGKIDIDVAETLVVEGTSEIATFNNSPNGSRTDGGIEIDAGTIIVRNAGQIVSRSDGAGAGGPIVLNSDALEVTAAGRVQSEAYAEGDGGPIEIHAESVLVSNEANHVDPTFIATNTTQKTSGGGSGGDLTVHTSTLDLVHGGQLFARSEGSGDAGTLRVLDADFVHLRGVDDEGRPSGITGRHSETATAESGGGGITIETRILEVDNGAQISSATFGAGNASDLTITADSVTIRGGEEGATVVSAASRLKDDSPDPLDLGRSGNLTISAQNVDLVNGGQVSVSTAGAQDAGHIEISADNVSISGVDPATGKNPSGVFAQSNAQGLDEGGGGGNITITTQENLSIADGGRVSVSTVSDGDAGLITLAVGQALELASGGAISALSDTGAAGQGGSIGITAGELVSLTGDSEISASTFGSGDGGDITITAPTVILEDGGQVSVSTEGTGDAGDIEINADNVWISGTGGDAESGADPVSISAAEPGAEDRTGVFAQSNAQGVPNAGAGGDITITTGENLSIAGDGRVSVSTASDGDAGVITLEVGRLLELASGSAISALSDTGAAGQGGSIDITAGELVSLTGGSEISASALGSGNAGKIVFRVPRFESQDSFVTTEAENALGGDIEIHAPEGVTLVDSIITTSVFGSQPGESDGGNITIEDPTTSLLIMNHSAIRANSLGGHGGLISISADALLMSPDSVIEAKAPPGLEGVVEINAPEVVLAGELATLPQSFLDASALLASACEARTARAGSFVVQRRAANPAPPDSTVSLASAGLPAVGAAPELPQCPLGEEVP